LWPVKKIFLAIWVGDGYTLKVVVINSTTSQQQQQQQQQHLPTSSRVLHLSRLIETLFVVTEKIVSDTYQDMFC